jgi:oxaloacetate decarboxylase alpha subunit
MMEPPSERSLGITDVVLRDAASVPARDAHAHRGHAAHRRKARSGRLLVAGDLVWGGATFDACIRYLGEDPWERLRRLKAAMPKTPQQMLLRGQNLLGYRHYADDVVDKFVERAAVNGIGVFRIFDAMNDLRNLEQAVRARWRPMRMPRAPCPTP